MFRTLVAAALMTAATWPALAMMETKEGDGFPWEAMQPYETFRAALIKAGWNPVSGDAIDDGYPEVDCSGICWAWFKVPESYFGRPASGEMIFQLSNYGGELRVVPEMDDPYSFPRPAPSN